MAKVRGQWGVQLLACSKSTWPYQVNRLLNTMTMLSANQYSSSVYPLSGLERLAVCIGMVVQKRRKE